MASRKTYFGIGLPKDPTDPPSTVDGADQSQPTVVDDEKVAEGLKQLRSWYQEASHEEDTRRVVAPPAQAAPAQPPPVQTAPVAVVAQARPTAVGHATGETPPQTQRPIAPDPMRATMFGHDVHRFDLEAYMAANATPSPSGTPTPPLGNAAPPPPAEERAYQRTEPPRQAYETRTPYEARHPVDSPRPVGGVGSGSQPGSSQLADFLRRQAERPNQAAFRMSSLDDTDAYPSPRVPMSARIVLVAGLAALTVAVVFWIRSRSNPDVPVMPPAPVVAPAPSSAPSGFYRPTAIPPAPGGAADSAQRRLTVGATTGLPSETTPTLPAVPTPLPRTVAPVIPAAPLSGETASVSRKTSTSFVAPAAPAKAIRRTRVATAPRPVADAPATGSDGDTSAKAADEKPASGSPDRGSPAPARGESPEKPSSEKVRDKRPVEKDNDATLPPSAE
jgi:hypothetical protein